MKKIIAFTILIGLFLMGCKKSSPPSTTSSPTATVDIAADIAGTWELFGDTATKAEAYFQSTNTTVWFRTITVTRISSNKISVSSSAFPTFTIDQLFVNESISYPTELYRSLQYPNFSISKKSEGFQFKLFLFNVYSIDLRITSFVGNKV